MRNTLNILEKKQFWKQGACNRMETITVYLELREKGLVKDFCIKNNFKLSGFCKQAIFEAMKNKAKGDKKQ